MPVDTKLVVVECFANFLCDDIREAGENPDVKKIMDQSLTHHFNYNGSWISIAPFETVMV